MDGPLLHKPLAFHQRISALKCENMINHIGANKRMNRGQLKCLCFLSFLFFLLILGKCYGSNRNQNVHWKFCSENIHTLAYHTINTHMHASKQACMHAYTPKRSVVGPNPKHFERPIIRLYYIFPISYAIHISSNWMHKLMN